MIVTVIDNDGVPMETFHSKKEANKWIDEQKYSNKDEFQIVGATKEEAEFLPKRIKKWK